MTTYSVLDICKETRVVPMPAGQIMGIVKSITATKKLQKPLTMECLIRARNNYFLTASILN